MAKEHDEARAAGGGPSKFTRADLAALRREARQLWGVPDGLKTETIFTLARLLTSSTKERVRIAAAKALAELDRIDQRDRIIALAYDRLAWQAAQAGSDDAGDGDYVIDLSDDDDQPEPPSHPPLEGDGPAT